MKLIIEDDEGRRTVVPFARPEITIGRDEGNTIRLTERNVSRKHARIARVNGHVEVEDLQSANGIRLNGERIQGKASVTDRDLIQIGDYDLAIEDDGVAVAPTPPAQVAAPPPLPPQLLPVPPTIPPLDMSTLAAAPPATPAAPEPPAAPPPDYSNPRRQPTSVIRLDELEAERTREVVELNASQAPHLVVLNTSFSGKQYVCRRTTVTIGRTDENDVALDHRSLSRLHAKLVRDDSGEWRIIDMQSANGILVNGEGYAQASLSFGDVIELGHVKLRFEGPGGSTDAPIGRLTSRGRSLATLLMGAGAVLLVGLLVLRWNRASPQAAPALAPSPPVVALPVVPAPPVPAPTPPSTVQVTVSPPVRVVKTPAHPPGPPSRLPHEAVAAAHPTAATQEAEASPHEVADRLYTEGKSLHQKQRLKEAEVAFKRCLTVDPTYARCHMMLGSTYALLKDPERGAFHYRKFVEMTPDDSHAEHVRQLLQKYDESVGKPGQR